MCFVLTILVENHTCFFFLLIIGYMGECGIRGGYAEVINLDPQVRELFEKLINISLCPATLGQVTL